MKKIYHDYKDLPGRYWCAVSCKARRRNLAVGIDIKDAWELFDGQEKKCALSGWDIVLGTSASIDRINSNFGYVKGNVQWLHKDVNISKWNLTQTWYQTICWLIANYKNLSLPSNEIMIWQRNKATIGAMDILLTCD